MKTLACLFTLLAVACGTPAQNLSEWTLQKENGGKKYKVEVPCTVAGALHAQGVLGKDIMVEENYKGIDKSQFDQPWVFTTRFTAEKGLNHILRFDGLNFYADIDVNGVRIASADTTFGLFCVREFNVTPLLKKNNTLKVTLRRAQAGDLNAGYVDWNPRPVDESMGITGPVSLISTPDVQVQNVYVKPIFNPDEKSRARILVNSILVNHSDRAADGEISGVYEDGTFTLPVHLEPGETRTFQVEEEVNNPRIWWTREMGTPELYHMDVAFRNAQGQESHHQSVRFGIRSITSEVDAAGHLQFILNGRKVLIKSGGWTDDIFMQDTPEKIEEQLRMSLDMGLNCIRFENIWGKDDTVYDLCDSLGLMAMVGWSCQWEWEDYCGLKETKGYGCINDPRSEDMAVRYFHDQVIRLRNHPAVIGWLTGSDRIPNPRLEARYLAIYEKEDYRPYVCSAKSLTSLAGPSGTKMEGPYEYVGPDYWYLDTKCGGAFGFNTETGPGLNLPQEESLRKMVGEKDLWPIGPAWGYHCTASASHMNNTSFQEKAMKGTYGEAQNLQDYVKKAHALDYDSTRSMFEAFRCNVPEATGIVMWMLNSAWPSLYWQMFDWWDVPTAGYFGTKKANAPVQLVYNYAKHSVYAVNDAVPTATYKASMKVYDAASKLVREECKEITVSPREPQPVFEGIEGPCFVMLQLEGEGVSKNNFYAVAQNFGNYDWKHADWWGIPIKEFPNLQFVSALPAIELEMNVEPNEAGCAVTLTNPTEVIAYQNILKAIKADGMLVPGVVWSDNFFTLLPGETRTLQCTLPEDQRNITIGFAGWNASVK